MEESGIEFSNFFMRIANYIPLLTNPALYLATILRCCSVSGSGPTWKFLKLIFYRPKSAMRRLRQVQKRFGKLLGKLDLPRFPFLPVQAPESDRDTGPNKCRQIMRVQSLEEDLFRPALNKG